MGSVTAGRERDRERQTETETDKDRPTDIQGAAWSPNSLCDIINLFYIESYFKIKRLSKITLKITKYYNDLL